MQRCIAVRFRLRCVFSNLIIKISLRFLFQIFHSLSYLLFQPYSILSDIISDQLLPYQILFYISYISFLKSILSLPIRFFLFLTSKAELSSLKIPYNLTYRIYYHIQMWISIILQFNNLIEVVMNQIFKYDILHSQHDQLAVFAILTFNWFLLYFIVHYTFHSAKLNKKLTLDTRNRIVSIIHGILSFVLAAWEFLRGDFSLPNTQLQTFICILSLSYSLYDTIACTYYGLADTGLYIHHGFCLIGFYSPIYAGYGAMIALGGLFAAEISNFPMHLRVVLRNYGLKYTKSYEWCENIYIAFYIIFRGLICPVFLFFPALMEPNSPAIPLIVCFGMTVQNFYYIFEMKKLILRKIKQYKQIHQKSIELYWLQENPQVQKLSFYKTKGGPKIF